ncbi:MAG TPA: T9SS type A sorting domain-containing protein [Bacteroidales bacterium]|nr:T9SS type A sorting domain-containing protein [Bacteroidales bacterium]HPS16695.1 T9SS type A sorting domain-containing protein [Bacteroidales bacterium]
MQPNPVSDNTIISFNLTKSENVKLNVMNLLGQEMINVADGNLSAGQYKYVVNRADFGNAGFYIVKINVDGNIITKKIIVK